MTQKFSRGRPLASGTQRTTAPLVNQGGEIGLDPALFPGSWARTDEGQFYSDGVVWRPVIPLGVEVAIPDWVDVPEGWYRTRLFDASGNRVLTNEFDLRYLSDLIQMRFQARLGFFPTSDRGLRKVGDGSQGQLTHSSRISVDTSGATTYRIRARVRAIGTEPSIFYAGIATYDASGELETDKPGTHRYAATGGTSVPNDGEWYVYEGTVTGNGNATANEFRPATVTASPLILANYRQGAGAILEVDELSFAEVTTDGDVILHSNPYFQDGLLEWDAADDWEPRESGGLWTTADKTTNVTSPPSLVGFASDTSDNGQDASQTISANRPTFDQYPSGHPLEGLGYFDFSTIDSALIADNESNTSGDVFVATEWGIMRYRMRLWPGVDVNIGSMGADIWYDALFIRGLVDESEGEALARNLIKSYGYPENTTGARTDWSRAFAGNNSLREFAGNPELMDMRNATDITEFCRGCIHLRTPIHPPPQFGNVLTAERAFQDCEEMGLNRGWDFSSCENMDFCFLNCAAGNVYSGTPMPALLSAEGTWQDCVGLEDFPPNIFDDAACLDYTNAWTNCALTQESVDNILVSINTARAALSLTGGRIDITGGTNASPSAPTGETAVNELRAAGWTVNVVGF